MNGSENKIEQITNRIFINFGIAIGAYILLWVLISRLSMFYLPVFIIAGVFFALAVVFFMLYKIKGFKIKNYSYMFALFALLLLITQSSFIVSKIMGVHKFSELLRNSYFLQVIFNTAYEVKIIALAGAIYLVIMLISNCIMINKLSKNKPGK
ncbi:MAG: hypothetical protein J1F64_11600 [Oscillospiraceae bacterium]|nr:hypothetical protein [Oscillospiraceae bacterium]